MSIWTTERPAGAPDVFTEDGSLDPTKWAAYQATEAAKQAQEAAASDPLRALESQQWDSMLTNNPLTYGA